MTKLRSVLLWIILSLIVVAVVATSILTIGNKTQKVPKQQAYAALEVPKPGQPTTQVCSGLTDTCVARPRLDTRLASDFSDSFGGYHGCKVPDVSSYQGKVDWNTARHYICGAVFKGGEYSQDPYAARNNSELAKYHVWRAMYWFVRDTGCGHEGNQIVALSRAFGIKVIVNDIEVPEAKGYAQCLANLERAAGLIVVTYGGPGTWPGGAGYSVSPLWQAEYGPVLHPFWQPVVAWQCTDGVYGCATYIPGIGQDDVSVDLGLTKLGSEDPYGIFPKTVYYFGQDHASEYNTVKTWDWAKCKNPVRRVICKTSHAHLEDLLGRIWFVSHNHLVNGHWVRNKKVDWGNNRGTRFQLIIHRLERK